MNYGHRIRELREAAGVKQGLLAERIGMTSSQLSARENGVVEMTQAEFMGAEVALAQI